VTQIDYIRLDSGGQTTISGIYHSNAIIMSVRYSVITLNKNASHFTWIASARSHTAREDVRCLRLMFCVVHNATHN
jgi:hypothetical protein